MNISQEEFKSLCQSLTAEMLTIMTTEMGLSLSEACDKLYGSHTFEKLTQNDSGLYMQSPRYILSYLMDEIDNEG